MKVRPLLAGALSLAAAMPALAAGPLQISSEMRVEQRVAARDGTTRIVLAKADRIVPGDRVVFVLTYRNTGTAPLSGVVLANPIPKGLAYRAPGQGSPAPELSVDGVQFGSLDTLRVRSPHGTRTATAADVTTVRWPLSKPIAARSEGQVSFQAVVN